MVRIALLLLIALFNRTPAYAAATPKKAIASSIPSATSQAGTKAESSIGPWIAAASFAIFVAVMVIKGVFFPTPTRQMTHEEIKAANERLLDDYSKLRMWQAVARNDGDALREEMKLMELRNLRRLNE